MDKSVLGLLEKIEGAGFEVALVGGAVRDILSGEEAHDWDFTTNAKPEEILKLFGDAFYNNAFGTVGVPIGKKVLEITTYRSEKGYSDSRHPDAVVWGKTLEDDLKRRDFTVNAMGLRRETKGQRDPSKKLRASKGTRYIKVGSADWEVVDLFGGQEDLKNKIIRAVGDADERFREDALRILRAVRFSTTLGFGIEEATGQAIKKNVQLLEKISGERIREELFKIVASDNGDRGLFLARDTGVLKIILPELDRCFSVEQKSPKRHHIYDVGTHCVMSMKNCPSTKKIVRFATLLHDIGKADVANITQEGIRTFYNHEVKGAHSANKISDRLHLSKDAKTKVFKLVRWHQFSVSEDQTDRAIRRFINNVGQDNVEDMMDLRIGDRLGGGLEEPESWRLKLFRKRIKEVLTKPFMVADLKINGRDVMEVLGIKPGPKVGEILNILFEEVVDDENKNDREYLTKRVRELESNREKE
ncbi:MAG: CCA tRNA nucleotidyltransferase [Patescibacteria group bacterium]